MPITEQPLDNNNKGPSKAVDKSYQRQYHITSGDKSIALYPVNMIQTLEFRALQVLYEVEKRMKEYDAFKSLLSWESSQHA